METFNGTDSPGNDKIEALLALYKVRFFVA